MKTVFILYTVDGVQGTKNSMNKRVEAVCLTLKKAKEYADKLSETLDTRYAIDIHEWEIDD